MSVCRVRIKVYVAMQKKTKAGCRNERQLSERERATEAPRVTANKAGYLIHAITVIAFDPLLLQTRICKRLRKLRCPTSRPERSSAQLGSLLMVYIQNIRLVVKSTRDVKHGYETAVALMMCIPTAQCIVP